MPFSPWRLSPANTLWWHRQIDRHLCLVCLLPILLLKSLRPSRLQTMALTFEENILWKVESLLWRLLRVTTTAYSMASLSLLTTKRWWWCCSSSPRRISLPELISKDISKRHTSAQRELCGGGKTGEKIITQTGGEMIGLSLYVSENADKTETKYSQIFMRSHASDAVWSFTLFRLLYLNRLSIL